MLVPWEGGAVNAAAMGREIVDNAGAIGRIAVDAGAM